MAVELPGVDAKRQTDTDEADKYRTHWMVRFERPPPGVGYTYISVLEFLRGRPWNNMALNFVVALRPSAIRVISPCGGETADAHAWRVTVYLKNDNRTIQDIEQEVEVGLIGCRYGADVRLGE